MTRNRCYKRPYNPYSDNRYYYARYLYVAAYLYAHGLELIHVEEEAPQKYVYVFRDIPGREELVRQFEYGPQALVDARHYVAGLEELKFQEEEADRVASESSSQ